MNALMEMVGLTASVIAFVLFVPQPRRTVRRMDEVKALRAEGSGVRVL